MNPKFPIKCVQISELIYWDNYCIGQCRFHFVQSDLDLHFPRKRPESPLSASGLRVELRSLSLFVSERQLYGEERKDRWFNEEIKVAYIKTRIKREFQYCSFTLYMYIVKEQ